MLKHFLKLTGIDQLDGSTQRQIDSLSRQVAEQSLDAVHTLVAARVERMTLCETRGYIRARAAAEIRKQTRISLVSQRSKSVELSSAVARRANEQIVPLVLRRLAAAPVAASTSPLRFAA